MNISKIGIKQQTFKGWIMPKGNDRNLELINTNSIQSIDGSEALDNMKVPYWDGGRIGYTHVKFADGTEKYANCKIKDFTQIVLDADTNGFVDAPKLAFYA